MMINSPSVKILYFQIWFCIYKILQPTNEILCSHNTKTKMSLVDTIHGIAYFVILNDAKFK